MVMIVGIIICGLIIVTNTLLSKKMDYNTNTTINIDPTLTKMYMDELKTMIEYETIYEIDVQFGNQFRDQKGITVDISNEDLYDTATEVQTKIISNISQTMLTYLSECYGANWIVDYIKITTLSMVLNYTDYTIYNIMREKK
jgi:hypothetical protein